MIRVIHLLCALGILLSWSRCTASAELNFQGRIDDSHHASYVELPFEVPAGTDLVTVEFDYPRGEGVTIDLGILDPQRSRGWSGGNKSRFVISETDATPSYLPGPLPAGEWKLLLGVPNADQGTSVSFTARITLESGKSAYTSPFASEPLKPRAGWYRGDLHSHTGHSDGNCNNPGDTRIPCPLWQTVAAAKQRGLDFIAITEHNARSHFHGQRGLQSWFDDVVLMPGQEITTFYGHANLLGSTGEMDFRLAGPDASPLTKQLARLGGILSINHPGLPSGKQCMGCGWQAAVDMASVTAVEVINGGTLKAVNGWVHSPVSGIPFWQAQLAAGYRITAIAGSDNHNALEPLGLAGAIGSPTTVIYADNLSQPALIDGIRRGRVFIDVRGSSDSTLELNATAGAEKAHMGGNLVAGAGEPVEVVVTATAAPDSTIKLWYRDILVSPEQAVPVAHEGALRAEYRIVSDGKPGWVRSEIVAPNGQAALISNAVYINFD